MRELLPWYVALQLAALAAWPLVWRAFHALPDAGWTLAKTLSLLSFAWLAWFLGMLLPVPFTRPVLLATLVVVGAANWWQPRTRGLRRAPWEALMCQARLLVVLECVFAATLLFFAALRASNPAISGTEKPMDMAFLNGFMTAQSLPTQDTWLAGFGVPYYYFGYFVFAWLGKLSGVPAGIAYNLAAATVPALAMAGVLGLVWNLCRLARLPSSVAGVTAAGSAFLVLFAGNLSTFFDLLLTRGLLGSGAGAVLGIKNFGADLVPGVWPPPTGWWFDASRVVPNIQPDGITEFPFFSAYLSDLHPHFMALPMELAVLTALTVHLVCRGSTLRSPLAQGASALALGSLLAGNTWDLATFWLLYVIATFVAGAGQPLKARLLGAFAAPVLAVLAFFPYFVGYSSQPLGLGIVEDRTPLGSLLVLFGPQIVFLAVLGVWARWRAGIRLGWAVALAGVLVGSVLVVAGQGSLGLLVALVALLLPVPGCLERLSAAERAAYALGTWSALILLGLEVVFVRDTFGTRMNTVFKFDYNVWLLAGIVGPVGLAFAAQALGRRGWVVGIVLALGLAGGLVYPVSATLQRFQQTPPWTGSLDGTRFLAPDELAAINWLHDQAGATRPVVAEAVGPEYSSGARMATFSGLATVLGWPGHELQWRGPIPELSQRQTDVQAIYQTASPTQILTLLQKYDVRYLVVGDFERQTYGQAATTRFTNVLTVAFQSGNVTVYQVPQPLSSP